MSENIDPKAKQEFLTMIGHSLEVLEDGLISDVNRQSIRNGILETISELMDQRDAANARAEAAEARVPELQAALDAAINMNIDANAQVVRLTAALEEANEDAARLASRSIAHSFEDDGLYFICSQCDKGSGEVDKINHKADCPFTLHRARVGGLEK